METIRNQINPQSVPLKFGRSSYDAVAFRNSSALFRRCCLLACPEFTVDERNRDFMNEDVYKRQEQKNNFLMLMSI